MANGNGISGRLGEIQPSELTMKFAGFRVVGVGGLNRAVKPANYDVAIVDADRRDEAPRPPLVGEDTLVGIGAATFLAVPGVLGASADSHVGARVVQGIPVDVIDHEPRRWLHKDAMEVSASAPLRRVHISDRADVAAPAIEGPPLPLQQEVEVSRVNERDVALGQRDFANVGHAAS